MKLFNQKIDKANDTANDYPNFLLKMTIVEEVS